MTERDQNIATVKDGKPIQVEGPLTFATVPALANQARHWIGSEKEKIVVDLAAVKHSDSAGLALLLQWVGDVRASGNSLTFINIPHQVEDYIRINGLAHLLMT